MKTRTIAHVEINGTAQCAANDVDFLESVNQRPDSRSHYDAHMRNFTCEEQGKKNSNRRDNRESRLRQAGRYWCWTHNLQQLAEELTKTTSGRWPAHILRTHAIKTDSSGASERAERTTCNHIDFVQWGCVHVQLSSKLVDQRATIMVIRPCFAAADQQQTEHRALALTFGSTWRDC